MEFAKATELIAQLGMPLWCIDRYEGHSSANSHKIEFIVSGADRRIICEFGEPRGTEWGRSRDDRMEQVTIFAEDCGKSGHFGFRGRKSRTYPVRTDDTLNVEKIRAFLNELIESVRRCTVEREEARAAEVAGRRGQTLTRKTLVMGEKNHATRPTKFGDVKVSANEDGTVTLKLARINRDIASELIRLLNN